MRIDDAMIDTMADTDRRMPIRLLSVSRKSEHASHSCSSDVKLKLGSMQFSDPIRPSEETLHMGDILVERYEVYNVVVPFVVCTQLVLPFTVVYLSSRNNQYHVCEMGLIYVVVVGNVKIKLPI